MAKTFDVFVLTAFGQGYRLARDLAFSGRKVAWLDITNRWKMSSRDAMGPFCTAVHPDATDLDRREFLQDNDLHEVPQGFTLIQNGKLFEARGEIGDYQAEQWSQDQTFQFLKKYCSHMRGPQWSEFSGSFQKNWFLYLATFFNKCHSQVSEGHLKAEQSLFPVFSSTYQPQDDFSFRKKREQDLKVFGVEILDAEELKFRREGETYFFYNQKHEMMESANFVNFISGQDLKSIDPTFYGQVFDKEPATSDWHWQRVNVELDAKVDANPVPSWLMFLENWDMPWREENHFILRKAPEVDRWDIWCKVKSATVGDSQYRDRLCQQLKKILDQRLSSNASMVSFSETQRVSGALAPPFSVYETPGMGTLESQSFYSAGSDRLGSFDLYDQHRDQKKIYQSLQRRLENG